MTAVQIRNSQTVFLIGLAAGFIRASPKVRAMALAELRRRKSAS